ncbi:hypothetical protein [Desnuesiella massiliensis]|uniref:hypothetical protein n=1 Tax=Desnuesiella massiliensis TaxID=1650662 RepID=UPI0006E1A2C2|nr:hypothetical protein [Desnuesiella massiliensis]
MNTIQNIFSNREIAIGSWILITIICALLTKSGRQFVVSVFQIIFCKKFINFYIVFLSFFTFTIYILHYFKYWNIELLKNTIFWIVFVEIPLFVKTIEKAKDNRFFIELIKDNIALITIIEFIFGFWSFSLLIEIILVPILVFLGGIIAFVERDEKYKSARRLLEVLSLGFAVVVIIFTIKNTIQSPRELINTKTLKEFFLPILLLFLNLPVVYGLALFNVYEQIFILLKGNPTEKRKMKKRLLMFGNINLYKISKVRNKEIQVLVTSLTDKDMEIALKKLDKYLDSRVGDNYMKRAKFYKLWCAIGCTIFIIGLIICNSNVGIKEIVTLNFVFDSSRVKEIITYICSTGIVICLCFLIYSIGYKKKKFEEISQIKKYTLHGYLYLLKRQYYYLKEFVPIDDPQELLIKYIEPAFELKLECDKIIASYDNLLKHWEIESIKQLQLFTSIFIKDICIDENVILKMSIDEFKNYYNKRVKDAPQNEKINTFTYDISKEAERYAEQVKLCYDEFKNLID